jgi:hypothetical protein
MPSTIDYNQRAQHSSLDYNSTAPFDLANFISRLYSPASIATKEYLQVRVLNFNLPFDNLASSGLLRLFGSTSLPPYIPTLPNPLTAYTDYTQSTKPKISKNHHRTRNSPATSA